MISGAEPDDQTARLDLCRPTDADIRSLHDILSDPAVWAHLPSRRHSVVEQTARSVSGWIAGWGDGLGVWVVRDRETGAVIGYGGCSMLRETVWNLGYRLAASVHGRGFATELAQHAVFRARTMSPQIPVIAYLLEHNRASAAAVARKAGLEVVHRAPDRGNPDPDAVRLVYADRPLSPAQLAATLG